jgi:hypothetical protein
VCRQRTSRATQSPYMSLTRAPLAAYVSHLLLCRPNPKSESTTLPEERNHAPNRGSTLLHAPPTGIFWLSSLDSHLCVTPDLCPLFHLRLCYTRSEPTSAPLIAPHWIVALRAHKLTLLLHAPNLSPSRKRKKKTPLFDLFFAYFVVICGLIHWRNFGTMWFGPSPD